MKKFISQEEQVRNKVQGLRRKLLERQLDGLEPITGEDVAEARKIAVSTANPQHVTLYRNIKREFDAQLEGGDK